MKVLVICTLSYKRLENLLDSLVKENPEKQYEFYIVNETYGGEVSKEVKYKNYMSIDDSSNELDIKKVLDCVEAWGEFDASIQTDEYAITLLAIINSKLGLKGLTFEEEHRFRDKVYMKQLLGNDIQKPKLYTKYDVQNNLINYPVIIKPRTFAASRGVHKVQNREDLLLELKDKKIDYTRASIDTIDDLEIEEFIEGDICHIDGIVFEKKIIFCVGSKYIGTCFDYTKGKILGSIRLSTFIQNKALAFAEKVNRDLKIPEGVFHLECFLKDEEFIFLEIGMRPGGGGIVEAVESATGMNLSKEHLKCQLGIKPLIQPNKFTYFGWLNYPCLLNHSEDAYVKKIIYPISQPHSLYSSFFPEIGKKATVDFINYANNLGLFIFASDSEDQLKKDMFIYISEYRVELKCLKGES